MAYRLRDRHVLMKQSLAILNVFNILIFKQIFWKTNTVFKNTGVQFLVKRTTVENETFPYKTAPSEANVMLYH